MDTDDYYMHRCIELAQLGAGAVAPNPMVGSVLVYNNMIVGEGYHRGYGQPHAEVNCLQDAANRYQQRMDIQSTGLSLESVLQKSTLYVSLEPCAHYGKTPPCADLIIQKKIPSVVVGCRDPFALVDGKGIEKLLAAGVQVKTGVLEQECTRLNKRFFTYHLYHRPYIILKWAQSANRKIAAAGGVQTLISNDFSNRLVHKWRSEEAAILVGTNTALADDPALTTRLWPGKNPLRLVLDKHLRLPNTLKLYTDRGSTVCFNYLQQGEKNGVVYYQISPDGPVVEQIMDALYGMGIESVLVEGGTTLLQSCIDGREWDEARVITNSKLQIAAGRDAPQLPPVHLLDMVKMGSDELLTCRPLDGGRMGYEKHPG